MSIETQFQLRQNATEASDFLSELRKWQVEVKQRDEKLTAGAKTDVTGAVMSDVEKADELKREGNVHMRNGRILEALSCYTRSLGLAETSICFANRAMAKLKLRDYKGAEADCTAALDMDSNYLKAYQRRSVARKEIGKMKEALDDEEMALRLQPASNVIRATFHDLIEELCRSEGFDLPRERRYLLKRPPSEPLAEPPKQNGALLDESDPGLAADDHLVLPAAPKNWTDFESGYKLLKHRPDRLSEYLGKIPPESLPDVLKSSLTAPLLLSIFESAMYGIQHDVGGIDHWISFLTQLKRAERYDMTVMCLGSSQKALLREKWREISDPCKEQFKSLFSPFL